MWGFDAMSVPHGHKVSIFHKARVLIKANGKHLTGNYKIVRVSKDNTFMSGTTACIIHVFPTLFDCKQAIFFYCKHN